VMEPNRMPDGSEVITPIVPVLVGDDWRAVLLWKSLYDAGVYVNVAIHPAVQRGGALLRTSVMATHERELLDRALQVFERVKARGGEMTPPAGSEPPLATPKAGADEVGSPS
jgi:8-amino-7-oxononanoate synthase